MGWHVHFKDGKFNIWSTIVDSYLLTEWVDEEAIVQAYREHALKDAEEAARKNIHEAKYGIRGCSALEPFKCKVGPP